MKKDFSRIQIALTGPPHARRYFIHKENGQMWGSDGWTDDLQEAVLFHRLLDCYQVIKEIEDQEMAGEKYRDYVVPLTIRVYVDEELDEEVIVEYIRRACRMCLDYDAFGPGPGQASLIQLGVRWGLRFTSMEELKHPPATTVACPRQTPVSSMKQMTAWPLAESRANSGRMKMVSSNQAFCGP